MTNPEYKKGDRVLVTLSGIEVPATVEYHGTYGVTVTWTDHDNENIVAASQVRPDPEFAAKVEVGTVLYNANELRAITKQRIVLVDRVNVAGAWSGVLQSIAWAIEDNNESMTDASSVLFPATIVAVLP